jgi:predicted nucleic acid-binding protein
MPFVVDASVAASWLLPDEGHPTATAAYSRLRTDRALVPSLWWFEIRNIFVMSERRGRLDSEKTRKALSLLESLPIQQDIEPDEAVVLRLARQHRLTVYDAAYLELAQRENVALATLDAELARAASNENIDLIG